MNSKKIYIIIIILVIFIIIIYSYLLINIFKKNENIISSNTEYMNSDVYNNLSVENNNLYEEYNNEQEDIKAEYSEENNNVSEEIKINHYEEYNKILNTDSTINCVVNKEKITDRDIEITKYLYQENDVNEAKKIAIENKVLLQKLENDNIKLNEENKKYIENLIQDLKNNSTVINNYTDKEKKEIIEELSKNLYNNALIIQFKADFIKQLANETFFSEDKDILEKYNECLNIQEKWKKNQGISYKELTDARENVYKEYINKLVSQSIIE